MTVLADNRALENRMRKIGFILFLAGIGGCLLLLFPQIRSGIIGIGGALRGRPLKDALLWDRRLINTGFLGLFCCVCLLPCFISKLEPAFTRFFKSRIPAVLLSLCIVAGIAGRIIIYAKVRSFWVDEAMLAESLIRRNFRELLASPLMHNQTAPALYLVVVKAVCAVFGYTETTLRIFSLAAFFGVLFLEAVLLLKAFKADRFFILFAAAVTATLPILIRYSNELKPYMGDAFFIIGIFLVYYYYNNGLLKLPAVTAIYCVILLFSSPALFFAASVFIVEFASAVIGKNRNLVLKTVLAGMITLAVFIVYYILWLMPVAETPYMIDFWKDNHFSFFAFSLRQIRNNILIVGKMLGIPGGFHFLFAIPGLVFFMRRKNKLAFAACLSVLLLLAASNAGKYPVADRLYLFIYPLNIIFMAVCFK